MANERYKICKIASYIAERNLGRPSFIMVSPSDQGKTDTVRMLLRDIKTAYAIPPSSPTELGDWLEERADISTLMIVDDPSDWMSKDFYFVVSFLKGLQTGVIRAPRSTSFTIGLPFRDNIATAMFLNKKQYEGVRKMLDMLGFLQRAVPIFSRHTDGMWTEIRKYYRAHAISNENPPQLRCDLTFQYDTQENRYDLSEFKGSRHETATLFSQVLPEKTFQELIPFLRSGLARQYIYEQIEFEESV